METSLLKLNLALGWAWILAGFVSGAILGTRFHHDNWLGGYASYRRRLYRLGHISFFGLALINLLFASTLHLFFTGSTSANSPLIWLASRSFAAGAVTMPICCILVAHKRNLHALFALPVTCLLAGAVCTLWEVLHL